MCSSRYTKRHGQFKLRATDWRHLLLPSPFILDSIMNDEMYDHNCAVGARGPAPVDQSDEIIVRLVANTFIS